MDHYSLNRLCSCWSEATATFILDEIEVGFSLPIEGETTRRIHIINRQHEHKRNRRISYRKNNLFSFLYEELLFGPFRPVVRTSSFHVEDTGSIPVRDRYLFPAGGIIAE